MTNRIFKFSPVNVFTLQNLARGELCCNHYGTFNDPFECWCVERCDFPDPVREPERFLAVISAWGFGPGRTEEALEFYKDYIDSLEGSQPSVEAAINSARISCFSRQVENLLMWSHYADGMRGFCIEFDAIEILGKHRRNARIIDVTYQSTPAVVDTSVYAVAYDQIEYHEDAMDDPSTTDEWRVDYQEAIDQARGLLRELYAKMLATKPLDWHYEQESRLIFHSECEETVREFHCYPASSIKSIVIGERMPDAHRRSIASILASRGLAVPLLTARRDRNSYRVIVA